MKIREALYTLVVGAPGFGKSTWIKKHLIKSPRKDVLLFKSNLSIDDKATLDFKLIKPGDTYTGGWARISDLVIEYEDFLQWVLDNFRNGAIIVDDAAMFEADNMTPIFKKLMINRRHLGIDIYYVYHSLTDVPIRHFKYTNNIVLFHTADNMSYKLSRLPAGKLLTEAKENVAKLVQAGYKYQPIIIKLTY